MTAFPPESGRDAALAAFARLRSGEMTPTEKAELEARLAADKELRASMDELSALWGGLDAIRGDPAILSMREQARRDVARRRFGLAGAALAAGLAAVAVVGWAVVGASGLRSAPQQASVGPTADYATRVGQITTVTLADGSVAILDTDSALRFSQTRGRRSVEMLRGRALFKVAKDAARPFVVAAEGKTVTAVGTEFDVYLKGGAVEVSLFEGRVRVEQSAAAGGATGRPAIELSPGYRLTASPAAWRVDPAASKASWAGGQLVFDEARIADIGAELNRYTAQKIAVTDAGVGEKRMSAVLQARDQRAFLSAVEAMQLARVEWRGGRYELGPR